MKKRDFILIIGIVLISGVIWLISNLFYRNEGTSLKISVDNQEYGIYDLNEEQEICIGNTNICEIKNGEVSMTYGDCPDLVCVHSASISRKGQTIICLPNRIVLEITGDSNARNDADVTSTDSIIDTIAE